MPFGERNGGIVKETSFSRVELIKKKKDPVDFSRGKKWRGL